MAQGHDHRGVENVHGFEDRAGHARAKDTTRWCRGKPGRHHEIQVGFPPNQNSYRRMICHRPLRLAQQFAQVWTCYHTVYCKVCGKILRTRLGMDCPNYEEPT